MSRILVVEDEQHIADGLRFNLEAEGHDVVVTTDGERALALILDDGQAFDVIVLDVMLPARDGFFVASALRSAGQVLPILMLSARSRPDDVLKGFEAGADDYLPKPFELAILIARVNGLLRRRRWNEMPLDSARGKQPDGRAEPTRDVYTFADRTLDFTAMEVQAGGKSYRLTQMECDLLRYLVTHAGQPVSRGALLENVWGLHEETDTRAIDNFIVRLRKYIEDRPDSPRHLQTVRGVGYKFSPSGQ
jgi:two-component system alkaline phosphatase synthesis response regulator PhoP